MVIASFWLALTTKASCEILINLASIIAASVCDDCSRLVQLGAMDPILSLLSDPHELTAAHTVLILTNMAAVCDIRQEMTHSKAVASLVGTLVKNK